MAIANLTARANFNCRKADYQRCRVRSGVKNIEGRIRNRNIKITQIFPQSRNIENKEKMDKLLDQLLWEENHYWRIANGSFYANFFANFYANFKGKLFILPHNIYDIKRKPQVAVHLQWSTNGLFVNKCTNDCLVTMLQSLLTNHRKTIKDQRVHISYLSLGTI